MEKTEFSNLRKKLGKTQKELAELLGTSLKAISSYEQGWRKIPGHIERQILYLLVKKNRATPEKCWDILQCPHEKRENCPAWEFDSGEMCWFINGTICDDQKMKTWHEKIIVCRKCLVLQKILKE